LKKLQVIKNDAKLQKSAEKLGVLFRIAFSRFLTIKLCYDVKKLENGKKVEKAYFSPKKFGNGKKVEKGQKS
jgi:hypothetical protein